MRKFLMIVLCLVGLTPLFAGTKIIGDVNVMLQDQHTEMINIYLAEHLDFPTITTAGALGISTIQIETEGFTPVAGQFICVKENDRFAQKEIMTVVNTSACFYTLTLAMPFDFSYTTGASICVQNIDLDVEGTLTTPVAFYVSPKDMTNTDGTAYEWDITRMIITMTLSTAGDLGKFGNLTRLTNGMYFRQDNGVVRNFANLRDNGDFAALAGVDVSFPARSGGLGSYGMISRITFAGQNKRGVTIRLCSESEDEYVAFIRDDLTSLGQFRIMLQGHRVDNSVTP